MLKKPIKKLAWLYILPSFLGVFWVAASVFFAALSLHIYNRLSDEIPIATITFKQHQKQLYMATLKIADQEQKEFVILGDQWRIDAQFIKLQNWVNLMGLDAYYKLERFEGRYQKVAEQNTKPKLAHDLNPTHQIQLPQFLIDYNFLIDAEYGSSTYYDIDESKVFTVFRTQSGIIVKSEINPSYRPPKKEWLHKALELF